MREKILMILPSGFPPDARIEKEAGTLIEHGYELHLLCNNYDMQNRIEDTFNGIIIHRLPALNSNGSLNRFLNMPFPGNYRWYKYIKKYVTEIKPSLIHIHDLPLMMTGIRIGRRYNIPVIFDRHEDYPEALRLWKQRGVIAKTIKNPAIVQKIEIYSLRRADHIIVVVHEAKEKLISQGVPPDKITVVSNTVQTSENPELGNGSDDKISIVYTGTFSPGRGLETAIEGMMQLKSVLSNSHLILVGDGPDKSVRDNLENLARSYNVADRIEFTGWANREVMWEYIKKASVCIVPQPSHPYIDNTIPHKLFEYMLLGKPVVVSDAKPLKRIVEECQCGTVFNSNSAEDFARAVVECYNKADIFGPNGREAVIKKYNWDNDGRNLLNAYQRLLNIKLLKKN